MKKLRKYKFTLAEILVSMAVFSILLVLMMQFFSGARTLWTANEKRSVIYSDAATALDLMTTLLQSTFCTDDGGGNDQTPFEVSASNSLRAGDAGDGDDYSIVFVSNSLMDVLQGGSVRYLGICRDTPDPATQGVKNNALYLKVFSDEERDFSSCFYEWSGSVHDKASALTLIKNAMRGFSRKGDSKKCKPILRNVTGLKITPLEFEQNAPYKLKEAVASNWNRTPVAILLELSLMENENVIKTYQSLSNQEKEDFRKQHEYTFRRTVWIGKRDAAL